MADIPEEKLMYKKDLIEATSELKLDGIDKIFILHDLYSIEETKQIKPFDNAIRLSFLEGSDIDSYVLETIAETINEAFRSSF